MSKPILAIVQARMGSTRLPGKVLKDICGDAMLFHVVTRTKAASTVNEVVVASTTEPADDAISDFCRERGLPCFRGNEKDVLDRYYRCACEYSADAVVRITSDCPLIDAEIIDKTVRAFLDEQPDYASNCIIRTYPRGLDTEIMTFDALQRAWREARQFYQRAHVTPYLYEDRERFKVLSVTGEYDYGAHRWTVDTPEDLEFVRAVYRRFPDRSFSWNDVLKMLEREPELIEINRAIAQKALHEG
jgi:spore coat polysaccharide biosynthesis protein SpsF